MLKEIPEEIVNLINQYKKKFNEKPRGWDFSEETLQEYKEYLEKELEK